VDAVHYAGAPDARPAPGVVEALERADLIVITPSNPYVSIGPILAVDGIRRTLERRRVPAVAVSPLIGGRAVRGPADRMLARMAGGTTPAHVASCYDGLIDALVVDRRDAAVDLPAGVRAVVTDILMSDAEARRRLAQEVVDVAGALA
jgi:LPPG:FO 2-phospho-L-lactate transferase